MLDHLTLDQDAVLVGVSKAILLGAIPPFLLQTDENPKGVPGSVFEGIKQAIVADRYAYFTVVEIEDGPHNVGWTFGDEVNAALLDFLGH